MENKIDCWLESIKNQDKYFWVDDEDTDICRYVSTEEEAIEEVKEYFEQHSEDVNSVSIYKKVFVVTPIITTKITPIESD